VVFFKVFVFYLANTLQLTGSRLPIANPSAIGRVVIKASEICSISCLCSVIT